MKTKRAEIDWIEIEVTIQGTTNLKAMRNAVSASTGGEKAFVTVMSDDPNSASVFRFSIHDPNKFAQMCAVLAHLDKRFPFALLPTVSAIEIAVDDYSKGPEQVADWYYGLTVLADAKNHRLYRDLKGSGQSIPSHRDSLIRKIAEGNQIAIGNKNADFYQHGYFKQTDHNKKPLPESKHRARIEITLRQGKLPCTTLENWADFPFEQLSNYFRFRTPKNNLSDFEQMILAGRQIGEKVSRNRKNGGTRLNNPLTKADPENEAVRNALRNLSRRWKSAQPGRPAKGNSCGNSGNVSSATPCESRSNAARSNNYISTTSVPNVQQQLTPDQLEILEILEKQDNPTPTAKYKVTPQDLALKIDLKEIVCTPTI